MFTSESASLIANKLVDEWNTKPIIDFMHYFTHDVEVVSSSILFLFPDSKGIIHGKESLMKYWEYSREKFPYHKYQLSEVKYEENVLILTFHNSVDNSFSYGKLHFNSDMKIFRMQVSYV